MRVLVGKLGWREGFQCRFSSCLGFNNVCAFWCIHEEQLKEQVAEFYHQENYKEKMRNSKKRHCNHIYQPDLAHARHAYSSRSSVCIIETQLISWRYSLFMAIALL